MSRQIERFLKGLLLGILFVTPLFVGTRLLYPFVVYRTYFFLCAVLSAWLIFIYGGGIGTLKGLMSLLVLINQK
jgi:hypothetical protein